MGMGLRLAAASLTFLSATSFTSSAHASEPRGVDWMKGIVALDRIARTGSESDSPPPPPKTKDRPSYSSDPNPQNLGNAWFGVAPRVSIVARDWGSSTKLFGDRLNVFDDLRIVSSTRMIVGRARLSHTRFTPFLQAGLGQWRVDRALLPFTPSMIEVATQLGTGFELRIFRRWQLAAEASVTPLFHEGQVAGIPSTVFWSSYVASRLEF